MTISLSETRRRLAYRGKPRTYRTRKGEVRRWSPRYFTNALALRWTEADQAIAIDRGYFVERDLMDGHARILPLLNGDYATDSDVMNAAERLAFNRDAHALKLVTFVAQQDVYGWTGVWANSVQTYNPMLRWYKDRALRQRTKELIVAERKRRAANVRWKRKRFEHVEIREQAQRMALAERLQSPNQI